MWSKMSLDIFWLRSLIQRKKFVKFWIYILRSAYSPTLDAVIPECVKFLLPPWIPPAHGFFLAPLPEVGWMRKTQWARGMHGGSKNLTHSEITGLMYVAEWSYSTSTWLSFHNVMVKIDYLIYLRNSISYRSFMLQNSTTDMSDVTKKSI